MVNTIILKNGQAYVEEEGDGKFSLIPAHKWVEEQTALHEIALACELLYENRDADRFPLFLRWLFARLQEKYADRWPVLFERYLESPQVESLIRIGDVNDILSEQQDY
ncbi:MAG: hypothetical protein ACLFVD_01135 [Dehalococcoidia bacterium]